MINPSFPSVQDVCDRISSSWGMVRLVDEVQSIHVSHVIEPEIRESLAAHVRRDVALQAAAEALTLVTPIEIHWIVTPRVQAGLAPEYGAGLVFRPEDGIPADWRETGSFHCQAYAFGLPDAALRAAAR